MTLNEYPNGTFTGVYDYGQYNQPRTVKTKTVRTYEYDDEGRVVKETVTIEETKYENGYWGAPYVTWTSDSDIKFG